jgi:hypothetical protein
MSAKLSTHKYNLQEIKTIMNSGFEYTIPDQTIELLNYLTEQIGSNSIITDNVFYKKDKFSGNNGMETVFRMDKKKRKGNKCIEITNEDWDSLRSFQATKIEEKTGIDAVIDKIRLTMSKLTKDKFQIIKTQLVAIINETMETNNDYISESDRDVLKNRIGNMIYDIALSHMFFSKMYADFYTELLNLFDWLQPIIDDKLQTYLELFKNMQYFDPDKDYDKFCDMNAINEKRKSATLFFVNLSLNGVITEKEIYALLVSLLKIMYDFINQADKKFEVDELTENIAILFNKELIKRVGDEAMNERIISDLSIIEMIHLFAKSKAKDFKSLSNKSIFKYMDLVEM